MMMLTTSIDSAIFFLLIQITSGHFEFVRNNSSLIRCETTNPAKSWQSRSVRSKRSIYNDLPQSLQMIIQYEGGPVINVSLIKQQPILANKYLPVIGIEANPFREVMDDVGEFVMYHDIQNCVAIVYFEKLETFHGVIGLNHYIAALPYNFDADGNYLWGPIGKPYVSENHYQFHHINPNENYPPPSDIDAWEDFLRPSGSLPNRLSQQYTWELQSSTSRQLNTIYDSGTRYRLQNHYFERDSGGIYEHYVETLVLVTRDLTELFKVNFGEDEYIAVIVRYHLIYYNAVNMLLRRLGTMNPEYFRVTINIAKIVIESDSTSFGFEGGDELQFTDVITKIPQFLSNHSDSYVQDSIDYVFVHTSRSIMDGNIIVDGLSKYGQDMVEGRKTGKFYETIPITVTKSRIFYAHYSVAAHEIGRTLGLKITPKQNGLYSIGQCSSIMQKDGPKCNMCLVWTDENFCEFLTFFSKNRNRCFLLNEPRSLYPAVVIKGITPNKQCQCLGYKSYIKIYENRVQPYVYFHDCSIPLLCQNVNKTHEFREYTILPFDGIPCTRNKVCWNKKCQKLWSTPIQEIQEQQTIGS